MYFKLRSVVRHLQNGRKLADLVGCVYWGPWIAEMIRYDAITYRFLFVVQGQKAVLGGP